MISTCFQFNRVLYSYIHMDLYLTQQDVNNLHFGIAFPVDSYRNLEFPLQHCELHFRNQNSPINKEKFLFSLQRRKN